MLKVLIKSRFQSLFYSMFKARRANRKQSLTGTSMVKMLGVSLLAIYVIGCLFFAFGSVFYLMCDAMVKGGYSWLYFAMVGIVAMAMGFIGSIFTTQAQLYQAKDTELLLSMPIPARYILASRLIMLLGLTLIYESIVVLPAGIVYCMFGHPTVVGVILYIVGFLLLAFLIMTLSCIVGWLVNLITSRMKNKTIITMVLSLGFLAAYFYLYSKLSEYMNTLIDHLQDVAKAVERALFPLYQLGVAIGNENFVSLLLFALCALVPFTLVCVLLAKSFIRMSTMKRGASRVEYKEKELKVSSPKGALVRKELKHFTSSAIYMMNAGLGVVFLIVGAIALLVKQNDILLVFEQELGAKDYLVPLLAAAIAGISAMNFISAPSVSLEGKNLWIAQSIPVDTFDLLMAKVDMHLIICLPPVLFASTIAAFVTKAGLLQGILLFLIPILYTMFSALFGLVLNLKFPKFNWVNEMVAIKQSLAGVLAMFGCFAMIILPVALYGVVFYNMITVELFMWLVSLVLAILCLVLYFYIKKRGTIIFRGLSN